MEDAIRNLIRMAEEKEDYELAEAVSDLLFRFADTINCPSNWRHLGEALCQEYRDNGWVMEHCRLYDYE